MNDTDNISCEEALKRVFAYLDRELDEHAHGEMAYHLSRCRSCFSRTEFERRLKMQLRETGRSEPPSALQTRIRQLLGGY
jgi:mycothiol system anti-sigma-R factor